MHNTINVYEDGWMDGWTHRYKPSEVFIRWFKQDLEFRMREEKGRLKKDPTLIPRA